MEDLEALNRRSHLPKRIIQDRPREPHKKRLWGEIKADEEQYNEIQETRTIKNATTNMPRKIRYTMTRAQTQRQREQSEAYRLRQVEEQRETQENKEDAMGLETENASMAPRKQHQRDDKWRKVDSRAIITGTRLEKAKETTQGRETQRFQIDETKLTTGEPKDQIIQTTSNMRTTHNY